MKIRLGLFALYPLLLLGLLLTAIRYLTCVISNTDKSWHIALMIDETCNVDANGRINQTISARAALAQQSERRWGCVLCRVLNWVQKDHCKDSLPT